MGGTFDPVHFGHLIMAESVMNSLKADGMIFVPARRHPLKSDDKLSDYGDRAKMVELAIGGNNRFRLENPPDNSGYTIDLIDYMQNKYPKVGFFLPIGSDIIGEFDAWYKYEEIEQRIKIVIASRPGYRLKARGDNILGGAERIMIPQYDISSSDIRKRVRRHASIKYMAPEAVEDYIREKKLYEG
jgi:nicotinate-nucleotide adenylyltransferase